MINDSMKNCRYCQVAIDPGVAELIATRQTQVNQACSDASYLRSAAVGMYIFFALGLVIGLAYWAFLATFVVTLVMLILWQVRFSNIVTDDPDYVKAKKSRTFAFILVILAIPLDSVTKVLLAYAAH